MINDQRVPWSTLEHNAEYNLHSKLSEGDNENERGPHSSSAYENLNFSCHYYDPPPT